MANYWPSANHQCPYIGSDGKVFAQYTLAEPVVTGSIPGVHLIFGIVWIFIIFIPARLIKQPNGSLCRMCVQAYMRVK